MNHLLTKLLVFAATASPLLSQVPTINAVLNGGSFDTRLCPGASASIFGSNLGTNSGTSVFVGGQNAIVSYVSASQINFVIPPALGTGATNIAVNVPGFGTSSSFPITLNAYAPAFLTQGGTPALVAFQHSDNSAITLNSPARPNENISGYLVALGPTNPSQPNGVTPPSPPIYNTTLLPTVTINAESTQVTFSGLAPGLLATYQVNLRVPSDALTGILPIILTIGGFASNTGLIPISGPPSIAIDGPATGSPVSGVVTISGWALDNILAVGTSIGSVQILVDGAYVGSAAYGMSRPDVCAAYSGRPGCPNVGYSYSLNTSTLAPGNHSVTAVATDTDSIPDSGSATITIVAAGAPRTAIDSPTAGAVVSGTINVSGWAIDNASTGGTPISSVQVFVDGNKVGNATYGAARPDVCGAYPGRPNCPNVGFSFALNTASYSPGQHTIMVTASDSDSVPDSASASITVTVIPAPGVYIDSLTPGAVVTGVITVSGWALDNLNAPGTAISSVQVQVDGNTVGTASYGIPRPDVCAAYPGRPGCPNVGFMFLLDTKKFAPGSHALTAVATDSDSNPDMGSWTTNITITLPPNVNIDGPAPGANVSGTITVSGWAIDNTATVGSAIGSVQIQVDGVPSGTATYGVSRPDVCTVYIGRAGCPNVGFSYTFNGNSLALGPHTITAIATDLDAVPDSSSTTVTVNVVPSPLVAIDSPAAGSVVSGMVTLTGWAVAPLGSSLAPIQVLVDGKQLGLATYGVNRPDVCAVYPGRSGCPNVGYTFQLNTTPLSSGPHLVTIVAMDTESMPQTNSSSVMLTVSPTPTVYVDSPSAGATVSGIVTVTGWALDNASSVGTAISAVNVLVDGNPVGSASYGVSRPDVCSAFPNRPGCPNVGFTYQLDTTRLSGGSHLLQVVATDSDGTMPDSATWTITITVVQLPAVAIESPVAGATISGTVTVTGWAIDNASVIGTAISAVKVLVDGVQQPGLASYGILRPDVCAAYPSRPNCPAVGYSYPLNTASLATGAHVLTVVATDSDTAPDSGSANINVIVSR